jgi:LysR family transcriptional regulator, nitrogen assimilation regulatory protein
MNIEDALVFAKIVRLGSISRASEHLHTAQSALSRRLQRLETSLGRTILHRHARGVEPTEAGLLLMAHIEVIEQQISEINKVFCRRRADAQSRLSIALPRGAVQLFGAELMNQCKAAAPHVLLNVMERESAYNCQAVVDGAVDLCLSYSASAPKELAMFPLLREKLYLIGPRQLDGRDITYPKTLRLTDLAQFPLIMPGENHGYRLLLDKIAVRAGIELNIAMEVNGLSAINEFVRNGLGYALTTLAQVKPMVDNGQLTALPLTSSHCSVHLSIFTKASRSDDPLLVTLRQVISSVAKKLPPSSAYSLM